jgi:hypothetical protein
LKAAALKAAALSCTPADAPRHAATGYESFDSARRRLDALLLRRAEDVADLM